jgi:hypothetical protein
LTHSARSSSVRFSVIVALAEERDEQALFSVYGAV